MFIIVAADANQASLFKRQAENLLASWSIKVRTVLSFSGWFLQWNQSAS
jgi:hypothetical protein